MRKIQGTLSDFAHFKEEGSRYVIGYGLTKLSETLYEWFEVYIYKRQQSIVTLADVKTAIIADINERTRQRIIGDMVWNDKPVWLSVENQLNFAAGQAPATFKIGEQEDGTPVYHTFETAEDLTAFWKDCAAWRQKCLEEGNKEKDDFDWTPYEALFPASADDNQNGE